LDVGDDTTNDSETDLNVSVDRFLCQSIAEDSQSQHLIYSSMSESEAQNSISQVVINVLN